MDIYNTLLNWILSTSYNDEQIDELIKSYLIFLEYSSYEDKDYKDLETHLEDFSTFRKLIIDRQEIIYCICDIIYECSEELPDSEVEAVLNNTLIFSKEKITLSRMFSLQKFMASDIKIKFSHNGNQRECFICKAFENPDLISEIEEAAELFYRG